MENDLTILYVEDEVDIQTFMRKSLSRMFKNVLCAYDGEEAFGLFMKNNVDIVLTDITMPKMNGLELSTKIKKIAPEIPIVIISAFSDTKFLLEAIEIGISRYLTKPINTTLIKNVLQEGEYPLYVLEEEVVIIL